MAKVEISDPKLEVFQRKLALDVFFKSMPYAEFSEQVNESLNYADEEVKKLMKRSIDQKDLSKLNFENGVKAGLEIVLNILTNMKSELEDNSPETA